MISACGVSKRENPPLSPSAMSAFEIPKLAFAHYVQIRTHQYAKNARCRAVYNAIIYNLRSCSLRGELTVWLAFIRAKYTRINVQEDY